MIGADLLNDRQRRRLGEVFVVEDRTCSPHFDQTDTSNGRRE
jgi:hypothetical protein